jgi:hypothetical protein
MLKGKRGFSRGKSISQAGIDSLGWGFLIPVSAVRVRPGVPASTPVTASRSTIYMYLNNFDML